MLLIKVDIHGIIRANEKTVMNKRFIMVKIIIEYIIYERKRIELRLKLIMPGPSRPYLHIDLGQISNKN